MLSITMMRVAAVISRELLAPDGFVLSVSFPPPPPAVILPSHIVTVVFFRCAVWSTAEEKALNEAMMARLNLEGKVKSFRAATVMPVV